MSLPIPFVCRPSSDPVEGPDSACGPPSPFRGDIPAGAVRAGAGT